MTPYIRELDLIPILLSIILLALYARYEKRMR